MQRRSAALAPSFAIVAIVAIGIAFTVIRQATGHGDYLVDLRAFYCGGWSVLHHNDPYASAAVACSRAIDPTAAVLRAPHPPFALLTYALLALAPFKIVAYAYIVLAWCAVGATALVLSHLTKIHAWVAALGSASLLGYHCITFGQPTPFIALCLALSALQLVRRRFTLAAALAALTLVYPQVGLPVVVAMFVCVPEARIATVTSVALLGLIGLAALGPAANVHYVTMSLKLEQLQTAGDSLQYGLPWLLQQLHVSAAIAALAGSIWYVVVIACGIVWLARNRRAETRALVVLLPAALVPLCSSFVHPQHFALALPAAMFVLGSNPPRMGPVALGCALLTVPWFDCIVARAPLHDGARATIFALLGIAFVSCFVRVDTAVRVRPALRVWNIATAGAFVAIVVAIHLALDSIASADTPPSTLATLSFKLPSIAGLLLVFAYGFGATIVRREPTLHG